MSDVRIPELLAPAGNMQKAKVAIAYGADALYLAGKLFGMRASAGNFSVEELQEITAYAHQRGVKIYVTVNIFPHNSDLEGLPEYLETLNSLGVDGLIIADVGVYRLAKQYAPKIPLHLSTQANTVNWQAAKFWEELGIERLVMARELTKEDIAVIADKTEAEIEVFVHGAMCMAYSGRCLLSHVMTGRDANRGACAQSCRWKYTVMEEQRPGEYYPIWEEDDGTYIFNSKDLCLIEYIPELATIGVDSLKIEGRMKSVYYVATVVRAYRQALDDYRASKDNYQLDPDLLAELDKVSHRPYYTGFFLGKEAGTHLESSGYTRSYDFLGLVEQYDKERGQALVDIRNPLVLEQRLEVMQPRGEVIELTVEQLIREGSEEALAEAHANYRVWIPMPEVKPYSILRMEGPAK